MRRMNISQVPARHPGAPSPARTALIFCPVPSGSPQPRIKGYASQSRPLATREDANGRTEPRHCLMAVVAPEPLPSELTVALDPTVVAVPAPAGAMPPVEVVSVERKSRGLIMRDVGEVRIGTGTHAIGLRMGLETTDGEPVKWWEWVTLEQEWAGELCASWRIGGYVAPRIASDRDFYDANGQYNKKPKTLHVHDWLYCELHVLTFVNGVVRIHARHINNRYFDRGLDLQGIHPVIGFSLPHRSAKPPAHAWEPVTGSTLAIGTAQLNVADAATLSNAAEPARSRVENGILEYQPYRNMGVWGLEGQSGGKTPEGAPRPAEGCREGRIPRGMTRTVRLTLGLNGIEPVIARYTLPPWYHAACGTLWPDLALPVQGPAHRLVDGGTRWLQDNMLRNCFDDGSIARGERWHEDGRVAESGWEGETPFALMRSYYLSGDLQVLDDAIRDAYNVADVATDHTDYSVHMHGHNIDARSLPMQRVLGIVSGYLETGDPYLLETAQAIVDHAYWWDRTNWPRRSIGRDAAYIRGLLALADVTDTRHYLQRAREALRRCAQRQREDGSFADQGGTIGLHATVNEVIKPWMNSIMSEAMLDFLDRASDPVVEAAFLRLAHWFVTVAIPDARGRVSWAYKYRHGENEGEPSIPGSVFPTITPGAARVPSAVRVPKRQSERKGKGSSGAKLFRPLLVATLRTGDPAFLDLCLRNLLFDSDGYSGIDQSANKCIEQGSWFDSHLWNASWADGALSVRPAPVPEGKAFSGTIVTPQGAAALACARTGAELTVTLQEPVGFPVRIATTAGSTEIPAGKLAAVQTLPS